MVLCAPFRHPAVLAKMAATLDVLSGGRLELGLGWGSVPDELERYGIEAQDTPTRVAWLEETLEVVARMCTGETFSYDGPLHSYRDAIGRPVPLQATIPVHLGGAGPKRTLPLVARYADWWNCPVYAVDRLDELRPSIGNARISLQRVVGLASSSANRADVVATAERRFGAWGGLVAGTPDEVSDVLRRDVGRGVELFVCQFSDFGDEATLRLFAAEVLPALSA
jgi:alkanesulfonate monooxygenase SsuD/methylene tetrahydromethanopterin reductase-like flavin-dependent oxidoreductase (luciferase family)